MIPAFERELIQRRILQGLSQDGPSPLHKIYGFCGATDGGQQHFVRRELSQLASICKVRRNSGDLYSVTKPVAVQPEPAAPEAPAPEPQPDAASEPTQENAAHEQPAAADMTSAAEEPRIEIDTQPAPEELEMMQTQTNGSNGHASVKKGTPPSGRPKPLKDFIVTLLGASDKPMSIEDVTKAAFKKGVTSSEGSVSVTLQNLARSRQIAKPETGMYAGAKVVYDASKPAKKKAARPKRTAEDVKKVALGKKATPVIEKKTAPVKAKPTAKTAKRAAAKTGRKPSPLKSLYERVDAKIDESRTADNEACAGIRDIDEQVASLQKKRVELVAKRDAARESVKKFRDGRKRIAELEAGVADILKA